MIKNDYLLEKNDSFFKRKILFKHCTSLIHQVVFYHSKYSYMSTVKQRIYWRTGVGASTLDTLNMEAMITRACRIILK